MYVYIYILLNKIVVTQDTTTQSLTQNTEFIYRYMAIAI